MKLKTVGAPLALLLLGAATIVGCSSSVASDELEKQVSQSYEQQAGVGLSSISCQEAATDVGSPISCDATNADGIKLAITGKVTAYDSDSQSVDFSWNAKPVANSGG